MKADRISPRVPFYVHPLAILGLLSWLASAPLYAQDAAEGAAANSTSGTATVNVKIVTVPTQPAEDKSKSPHLIVSGAPQPEIANRRTLEQNAGKHPCKLLIRAASSIAQVWISGMFVGSTPLLLMVAPGEYQVELRGPRMERARSAVDLLPDETRVVTLALAARYPTRVSTR